MHTGSELHPYPSKLSYNLGLGAVQLVLESEEADMAEPLCPRN